MAVGQRVVCKNPKIESSSYEQTVHLLRVAIGTEPCFGRSLTSDEWKALYRVCVVQGVTAVVFDFVKAAAKV